MCAIANGYLIKINFSKRKCDFVCNALCVFCTLTPEFTLDFVTCVFYKIVPRKGSIVKKSYMMKLLNIKE